MTIPRKITRESVVPTGELRRLVLGGVTLWRWASRARHLTSPIREAEALTEPALIPLPEAIGVLAWWTVMLAAPVILLRRWRRRARARHAPRPLPISGGQAGGAAPAATAATPFACEAAPAAPFAPRWPPEVLEPLCRYVDFHRRLELAASELRARLGPLPADRWRFEPYPLIGERRNTLLVLGETGIFVISATYAPGHWDDVITVSTLARKVQALLPGYDGEVRPAICHPFCATEPRIWHRADERGDWVGAWLVGGDSVLGWLLHFGLERGLTPADLGRFDALVRPNWLRGAIPTAATWPQISDSRSAHEHE